MDKITTTADIVAAAIHSLGFTPTSSVVLVLLNEHSVKATLRVDANPAYPASAWAADLITYVRRMQNINGAVVLSFEDETAMSTEQYQALGLLLDLSRCPIREALLIAHGYIRDYEDSSSEKIPFAEVETSNTALALMVSTDLYAKLAADIPPCTTCESEAALEGFCEEARQLDWQAKATRTKVCSKLIGTVMGYQCTGKVTPEESAWLAGMCTNKGIRDLMFATMATTCDDINSITAALLGEVAPDDWEFFKDAADAIYTALKHIPERYRTDLLAGLGWTRWIDGKGTEAMKFLDLAHHIDPTHRLTELLTRLIHTGQLPVSATTNH